MNEEDRQLDGVRSYLEHEVEFVRSKYRHAVADTRSIERYAVVIASAIWSWCAAHLGEPTTKTMVWVPFITTGLLGLRAWSINLQMVSMRRYLALVEQSVGLPGNLGWERNHAPGPVRVRVVTGYLFWVVLHVLSLVLALYAWSAASSCEHPHPVRHHLEQRGNGDVVGDN